MEEAGDNDEDMGVESRTVDASEELVSKPGAKSQVWQYFGLKVENGKPVDDGQVFCKICRRSLWARSGNTSNMMAHLRNNHKTTHAQLKTAKRLSYAEVAPQQPTIAASFAQGQLYPRHGKKWKELTDSITRFIAKDSLPIHTVTKNGFKDMIKKFDSRYEIPSSTYFSRTAIPTLYSNTKEKVAIQLQAVDHFASTTDMWSSVGSKPYISYTVHFIDKEWQLQSLALSMHFLPEDHTAPIISEALKEYYKNGT